MMQQHKHNWVAKANKEKYCSSCGVEKKTAVVFYQGYANSGVKAEAIVKGKRYILNFDNIEAILVRMIDLYGFKESKTKSQKIPRLVINSL